MRNNTWWDNGTQFADKPDLQFGLKSGADNIWARNLVVSKMNYSSGAGFAQSGTAATDNLVGTYAMSDRRPVHGHRLHHVRRLTHRVPQTDRGALVASRVKVRSPPAAAHVMRGGGR